MKAKTAILAFLAIAAYFLYSTWGGLSAFFTGDDGTNLVSLHGLWKISLTRVAFNAILPFTTEYRPVGGLFYRIIWFVAGFHSLPFRIICFGLMLLNLVLVYHVINRIARSRTAAVFGLLFFAYHPSLIDLYFNTGTVYDLLCLFFYCGALLAYIGGRRVLAAGLFILALNSKEMALTFPVILLAYEVFLRGGLTPFRLRRYAPIAVMASMAVLSLIPRLYGPQILTANPLYRPTFQPAFLLRSYGQYGADLLDRVEPVDAAWLIVGLAVLFAVGWALRDRTYLFGLLFTAVTLIPVCVIPPRAGYVLYLPMVGVALMAGRLVERASPKREWITLSIFLCILGMLVMVHARARARSISPVEAWHNTTRSLFVQLRRMHPSFPPGSTLLFEDDPYGPDDWALLFLTQLAYADPSIWIDRRKKAAGEGSADDFPYDYVLTYRNGVLTSEAGRHTDTEAETTQVIFKPSRLKRQDSYQVTIPRLANRVVDVWIFIEREGKLTYNGPVHQWCRLNAKGQDTLMVPGTAEIGTYQLRYIRPSGGKWIHAVGSLEVVPDGQQ